MNPFDELTLGEVDELTTECLDGKSIADSDAIKLAGAVMFMHQKRTDESLTWKSFMQTTRMGDIKKFSELMTEDESDPTNGAMP
jgi:hypothetical protein